MINLKHNILFLLFIFVSISTYCQDIILLKNGEKYIGKIIKDEGENIYFEFNRNDKKITTYVQRNLVDSCVYENSKKINIIGMNTSFSINIGLCLPMNEFKDKNFRLYGNGMAGKGMTISTDYVYYFFEHFGFAVKAYMNNNIFDISSLTKNLTMYSGFSFVNESSYYKSKGVLAGIAAKSNINRFTYSAYLLAGNSLFIQPETKLSIQGTGERDFLILSPIQESKIIYNCGGRLSYGFGPNFSINLSFDYFDANYDFKEYWVSNSFGDRFLFERGGQRYLVICYSIGLMIRFRTIL